MMHRLAIALGGRTIAEWQEVMGAAEFQRWVEYYNEEPFGALRDNWHMAQLANMYQTVHAKKGTKSSPDDFFYKSEAAKGKENIKRMMAGMSTLAAKKRKEAENND